MLLSCCKREALNHLVHVLNSFLGDLQFKLDVSFNMQISLKIQEERTDFS